MACSFSQGAREWAHDSCLQGTYARSVVTWSQKVCGIAGWPPQHAALFDLWYAHPAPLKHQPPTHESMSPDVLLVLSALHMALLHPEVSILVLSPSVRQRRVLENLFLLYRERVGVGPWIRQNRIEPDGLILMMSNASRLSVRTLSCQEELLRVRGSAYDVILIEEQSSYLTYNLITTSLLPRLIGRAHPQTGSPTLEWCWVFSSSS